MKNFPLIIYLLFLYKGLYHSKLDFYLLVRISLHKNIIEKIHKYLNLIPVNDHLLKKVQLFLSYVFLQINLSCKKNL